MSSGWTKEKQLKVNHIHDAITKKKFAKSKKKKKFKKIVKREESDDEESGSDKSSSEDEESGSECEDGSELCKKLQDKYFTERYRPEYTPSGRYAYVDPRSFDIKEWDPTDLPEDKCISILWLGKRRTGKSFAERWYLARRYLNCPDDVKEVYVFTGSRDNGWYQEFLPECFVYDGWHPEIAKAIMKRGGMLKKKGENPGIVVLLDDLLSHKGVRNDDVIEMLYTKGRHFGCEVHFLSQKFNGMPPKIRSNADLVIIFTIFDNQDKKICVEEFFSRMNKTTANEIIDMGTDPELHSGIVIEAWRNDTDPENYLKFFVAEDPHVKPGDIGSDEYWEAGLNTSTGEIKQVQDDYKSNVKSKLRL